MWFYHPEFSEMMKEFRDSTYNHNMRWSSRLRRCKERLKSWNSAIFGNVQKRISRLKEELGEIRKFSRSPEMLEKEKRISKELDFWLAMEETLWMQRSTALWMEHRDKNTNVFHAMASHRRKKNLFSKLGDSQGNLCEGEDCLLGIVTYYFGSIVQLSISMNSANMEAQLEGVTYCITGEMNDMLMGDISEEEVKAEVRTEVCREVRVRQVANHSKYLGLPLIVGQKKIDSFRCIIDKVWRKINDWKSKLLSAAGRSSSEGHNPSNIGI
ncbi:hypothetical protein QQ045_028743 [Rhodiola kirilowii]